MKCPKCRTEMNQGVYAVMPPIPYVDCPKCGYHKEGDDIVKSTDDAVMEDIIYLNETVKVLKDEIDHLKRLLNARCQNLLEQIHDEKDIRYIYVIRERVKLCEDGWNIVGNVVYPTFNDANEKLKKLIKDYRQLEPDYEAENLNIIQVRLEG